MQGAEAVVSENWFQELAVPSMLIVAPRGRTKLETLVSIDKSSSAVLIETGRVLDDDEVLKATIIGRLIFLNSSKGLIDTANQAISGNTISP